MVDFHSNHPHEPDLIDGEEVKGCVTKVVHRRVRFARDLIFGSREQATEEEAAQEAGDGKMAETRGRHRLPGMPE